MNNIFIDLDGTIIDSKERINSITLPKTRNKKYKQKLATIQTSKHLTSDKPVPGVIDMFNSMEGNKVVFTSRGKELENDTIGWLVNNGVEWDEFHCRSKTDDRPYEFVKEDIIKKVLKKCPGNVIVFDDDPRGTLETVCRKHGWNLYKSVIYGAKQ